jgi:nucleotide-binding universal stress UspA family protein
VNQLPRNILVSLALDDGSESGAQATQRDRRVLEQALRMAGACKARVRVVHVFDLPAESIEPQYDALISNERLLAEKALEELVASMPAELKSPVAEITCVAVAGRPWMETLREAHTWGGDLIVLGPSVHDGILDRILHGSTAGRLIRTSPIPLWIVDSERVTKLRRILVPIDLRPVSAELIELANQLHAATGAERHLLHCVGFPLDISMRRHADAQNKVKEYHARIVAEAEARIDELLGADRAGWQVTLRQDPITVAVPEMIEKHDIDLMLIAGVSLPRVAGALLGTTAEKILSKTHAPSYVLKPTGWESPVRFD